MKRHYTYILLHISVYVSFGVAMNLHAVPQTEQKKSLSTAIAAAINVNKRIPLSVRAAALYSQKDMPALYKAAIAGNVARTKQLIAQGVNINEQLPTSGATALDGAIMRNNPEIVKTLIAAGARKDIPNDEGKTPAMLAKELNRKDIIPLLR